MAEGPVRPSAGCGNRCRPARLKTGPAPGRSGLPDRWARS